MANNFLSGFQTGQQFFNDRNKLALQQAAEERAQAEEGRRAQEFGLRMADREREDAAYRAYNGLSNGVVTDNQTGISDAGLAALNRSGGQDAVSYAMRVANEENAGMGLPPQYKVPGAPQYDANGAVIEGAGLQGPGYKTREATAREELNARRALALARRAGTDELGKLAEEGRKLDMSDISARVMKMSREELEKRAPSITQSGYPLLYTGKTKDGYTFLKTEPDGVTPIPGSGFSMNESQLRQLALAHEYGAAGFGTEALATLTAAHKDVGEHIARWNAAQQAVVTTGNDASGKQFDQTHKTNTLAETVRHNKAGEANDAARTAATRAYYGAHTPKDVPPELVAENNRLYEALQNEKDPVKIRELERLYNANQTRISTALNKPMQYRAGKPDIDEKVVADYMGQLTGEEAKLPLPQKRALVIGMLTGGSGGGMPNWGDQGGSQVKPTGQGLRSSTSGSHPAVDAPQRPTFTPPNPRVAQLQQALASPYTSPEYRAAYQLELQHLTGGVPQSVVPFSR